MDYRKLNAVSQADAYPMPRVDELLDNLGQAKYISTVDLTKGYWQVPVAEKDRGKTAFTAGAGLFQFNVMPFGLRGAPATFQRLMDVVLTGMGEYSAAYMDDVVIFSMTWEDHLQHIRQVLQKLQDVGLTIKGRKCQFGMQQCTYLGHVVGMGCLRPEAGKVEAVKQFPTPSTKSDVRTFLGLAGYYRKFIPNFASVAAPLTDLTRKSAPNQVQWSDECETAFCRLKAAMCSSPVLEAPDFQKPFILQTDASEQGVGAVLSQKNALGQEHPVSYFSRKLLPREAKYSTVEKECLAIKLAVQAFRVYLLGWPFVIQTDHRSLMWLDKFKDTNDRLARWSLALQPFQFSIVHRPGASNGNADASSRAGDRVAAKTATSALEKGKGV